MRTRIQEILDTHARKASASEYDRAVFISAVAAARSTVSEYLVNAGPDIDADLLLQRLQDLYAGYHDPDGKYTSGKGAIGDLMADLGPVLRRGDQ